MRMEEGGEGDAGVGGEGRLWKGKARGSEREEILESVEGMSGRHAGKGRKEGYVEG